MRRAALAAAVALLMGAAPAAAETKVYEYAAMATAMRVWHNPCGGKVKVTRDLRVAAYAGLAFVGPFYSHRPEYCRVMVSRLHRFSPAAYCALLLHEVGHLAGRRHNDNPNSVMSTPLHADYRCRYLGKFWVKRS